MTKELLDIAVIGGGVGGCAAAILMAQAGYNVVLCEAKTYPHHKVCGEFLSPECTTMFDELGLLSEIQAARPALIDTVQITSPDGIAWKTKLPVNAIGLSRYALDRIMAEHARKSGVEVREATTVGDIQGDLNHTFRLEARTNTSCDIIHARTVIGAQGKRSSVDRIMRRAFMEKTQPFVALKAHFYGGSMPGRIDLHSFPGGYCGISEIEDSKSNVCLLVRQETFQRHASTIDDFVDWMKKQNPLLSAWLSNAQPIYDHWLSIAQVPFVSKQSIVNDVLMIGDAAGLIAPVAGDGMAMALHAGQIAAMLLNKHLRGLISASELREQYRVNWVRTFRLRLRLSRVLQEFMLRPNWLSPGLQLMNMIPTLGNFLVTHTRDSRFIKV